MVKFISQFTFTVFLSIFILSILYVMKPEFMDTVPYILPTGLMLAIVWKFNK